MTESSIGPAAGFPGRSETCREMDHFEHSFEMYLILEETFNKVILNPEPQPQRTSDN